MQGPGHRHGSLNRFGFSVSQSRVPPLAGGVSMAHPLWTPGGPPRLRDLSLFASALPWRLGCRRHRIPVRLFLSRRGAPPRPAVCHRGSPSPARSMANASQASKCAPRRADTACRARALSRRESMSLRSSIGGHTGSHFTKILSLALRFGGMGRDSHHLTVSSF